MNAEQRTQLVDAVLSAKTKIARVEDEGIGPKGGIPWTDRLDMVREQGRLLGIEQTLEILVDCETAWHVIEAEASDLLVAEQPAYGGKEW